MKTKIRKKYYVDCTEQDWSYKYYKKHASLHVRCENTNKIQQEFNIPNFYIIIK